MIIDFHTHMFPHKIAENTIKYLAEICGFGPFAEGTYEGLIRSGNEAGVDLNIALPVATNPAQFASINRFASEYQEAPVISFGSIHPENEDYKEKLSYIKELGLKGIKFHPDYQEVYFNDIRYKRIISYAEELGLITVVHAGVDPKSPIDVHCTPDMITEVLDDVDPKHLVLAHMGSNERWDEVEDKIAGREVYFDTGVVLDRMDQEQFVRIVRKHGVEKILFGSDSPWGAQKKYVDIMKNMPLTDSEKDKIFSENAYVLLGIKNI